MSGRIPFIWTNDDITVGHYDQMSRQLEFLADFDLKGVFWVIPCPKGQNELTDDPRLIELLQSAMRDGHDVQQHTVTHFCIENGTADLRMFDLMGIEAKIEYSEKRFLYERLWEVDALTAHIDWGRRVWMAAFASPSPGYRPGCGSFCGNMYRALETLGFEWVSSRLVSMTGWMWQADHYDYEMRLEGPGLPFQHGNLVEFPILDDVAFRVPPERIDDYVELGWKLWEECVQRNWPYMLVSHYHGLEYRSRECEGGTGYAVHRKLLKRILESGQAEPMTMTEYYQRIKAGASPLATENLYPGADAIPEWHALSRK